MAAPAKATPLSTPNPLADDSPFSLPSQTVEAADAAAAAPSPGHEVTALLPASQLPAPILDGEQGFNDGAASSGTTSPRAAGFNRPSSRSSVMFGSNDCDNAIANAPSADSSGYDFNPITPLAANAMHESPGVGGSASGRAEAKFHEDGGASVLTLVADSVWLGPIRRVSSTAALAANAENTTVICVAQELCAEAVAELEPLGFRVETFPMRDGQADEFARFAPYVVRLIKEEVDAGRSVAVCCREGRSRSAACVVLYLATHRVPVAGRPVGDTGVGQSPESVLASLQRRYPRAEPNLVFLGELERLAPSLS